LRKFGPSKAVGGTENEFKPLHASNPYGTKLHKRARKRITKTKKVIDGWLWRGILSGSQWQKACAKG